MSKKGGTCALLVAALSFACGFVAACGGVLCSRCAATNVSEPRRMWDAPIQGPFFLQHDGYTVCYDARFCNPIWVYERLTPDDLHGDAQRRNRFRCDPLLPSHLQAGLGDYRQSGYDRGHMAAAANHTHHQNAMDETFYLTNMCPQVGPGLNRAGGAWFRLEALTRTMVADGITVHVVSGPLYLPSFTETGRQLTLPVIGQRDVAVPTHFFKLLVLELPEGEETLAFVLPNRAIDSQAPLADFALSVGELEAIAGFRWISI